MGIIQKNNKGGNTAFNGNRAITRNTPGLIGVTAGGSSVVDFLENVFFPRVAPAATISIAGGHTKEFGASLNITVNFSITKNTEDILTAKINGVDVLNGSGSQSGTHTFTLTSYTNTTFSLVVTTLSDNVTVNAHLTWLSRIYWGRQANALSGLSDAQILALNGAGVGTGSNLQANKNLTLNGINGAGQYLVFAFPASYGEPAFTVNGLPNTAFTKVRSNSAFLNQFGYSVNYNVYVSNTVQNSPIASFIIN